MNAFSYLNAPQNRRPLHGPIWALTFALSISGFVAHVQVAPIIPPFVEDLPALS
ncbi:MAG: hypothetical protein NHB36_00585 [Nitrospira sp.]|nr:hypothetical protein [Nitrospira sp.]